MSASQPMILSELMVRLVFHPKFEHPVVEVVTDDNTSLVEQLGLLEFAKDSVLRLAMGE